MNHADIAYVMSIVSLLLMIALVLPGVVGFQLPADVLTGLLAGWGATILMLGALFADAHPDTPVNLPLGSGEEGGRDHV